MTSTRLVGRAGELEELEAAFAEAESGSAALALVAGDSGVGKTRLLAELVARVRERGGQALSGECVDLGEGELPYDERTRLVIELLHLGLDVGRGDHADAAERLERLSPAIADSTEPQFLAPVGALQAELLRRHGELDGARAAVETMIERLESGSDESARLGAVAAAGVVVEADAAQRARDLGGDTAPALDRLRACIERVRAAATDGGPIERANLATAQADAARASGTPDPALYAAAAAAWEAIDRPYPAALARWREAEAQLARDDRDAAAAAAGAALATARRLGARWLGAELEALANRGRLRLEESTEPASAAEEPGDPFGLTPRERQVLALVARGATNREVGRELYMAEKTASVHVSRILAKLEVRSRTQAAAVAHRLGITAP